MRKLTVHLAAMTKLLVVSVVLTSLLVLNGSASAAPAQSQSGDTVTLQETAVAGTPTGIAAVELFLDPAFAGVGYANVVVDLDEDGLEASTDDWWVQNFPLVLEPPTGSDDNVAFTFDLGGLTPAGDFDVYASFTSSPVGTPSVGSMVLTPDLPFGLYDIGDLQEGTATGRDAGTAPPVGIRSSADERVDTQSTPAEDDASFVVDQLDADTGPAVENTASAQIIGRTRRDIPGIKQGKNECAPTSAAQSLLWLKKRYGDLEALPDKADLIAQLKTAMKWNNGIWPADFVPGKKEVTKDLPIKTKSGGNFNGAGTLKFIKDEIEAGEDVEMRIQYTGDGGHWVTIAGWYDDGTTKKLCFKDPLTGGTTVECYTIDGTTIKNYKYGNPATISFAVSESIIPTGGTVELLGQADSPADASGSASSRDYTAPIAAAVSGSAILALAAGGWYVRRRLS